MWALAGGLAFEKEPIPGFLKRQDTMFSRACPFAVALGGASPRVGVADKMAGTFILRGEPCPSPINTCALIIILSVTVEFTIISISQLDKKKVGELPEDSLNVREGVALSRTVIHAR